MIYTKNYEDFLKLNPGIIERNDCFIHFANLEKLGIKPSNRRNVDFAPAGIYAYPICLLKNRSLMNWATSRKYVFVFKLKATCNILFAKKYTQQQLDVDLQKLQSLDIFKKKLFESLENSDVRLAMMDFLQVNYEWSLDFKRKVAYKKEGKKIKSVSIGDLLLFLSKKHPGDVKLKSFLDMWSAGGAYETQNVPDEKKELHSAISLLHASKKYPIYTLYHAIKSAATKEDRLQSVVFNAIFRKLGYDCFVDDGLGIIIPFKTWNACVFSRNAIEWERAFVNKEDKAGRGY